MYKLATSLIATEATFISFIYNPGKIFDRKFREVFRVFFRKKCEKNAGKMREKITNRLHLSAIKTRNSAKFKKKFRFFLNFAGFLDLTAVKMESFCIFFSNSFFNFFSHLLPALINCEKLREIFDQKFYPESHQKLILNTCKI